MNAKLLHVVSALALALAPLLGCGSDDPPTAPPDATSGDALAPADGHDGDTAVEGDTSVDDADPPDTRVADTAAPPDAHPGDAAATDAAIADAAPDAAADTTTSADATDPGCQTLPPGHARHVVLSRPYTSTAAASDLWEVRPLLGEGALGAPTGTFAMGRARAGNVAFSPDGGLGFAPHDDGTIGVFALDAEGSPTVIAASLAPGAYVRGIVVDGDRLLLVDPNWPANGGGIYAASYDCHGGVAPAALLYATKNAAGVLVRGDDHLVAAREAFDTTPGQLHLLRPEGGGWQRVAGADVFGDDDAILSALAVTSDGRFALVGDNSSFSGVPNRIGAATLSTSALSPALVVAPIEDPVAIVASPYGDAVLVVTGFADAVRVLSYQPDRVPPFVNEGEPAYIESRPALPESAALVGGDQPGIVLVVENVAVRRLRFEGDGTVTDLGRTAAGSGLAAIPGAIGVQP